MKRKLSFLLALVIITSVLTFSVFADDGVEPCAEVTRCSACNSTNTTITYPVEYGNFEAAGQCDNANSPMVHTHRVDVFYKQVTCKSCGEVVRNKLYTKTYCVTRGRYIN